MLSVVSESRLIFLVHGTTTQKKKDFLILCGKITKRLEGVFFKKKYITLYRTLFKIQKRGFAIFTNMATCLRERKRELVFHCEKERIMYDQCVCLLVCVCVCVCHMLSC